MIRNEKLKCVRERGRGKKERRKERRERQEGGKK